jgi:hypothetical protein
VGIAYNGNNGATGPQGPTGPQGGTGGTGSQGASARIAYTLITGNTLATTPATLDVVGDVLPNPVGTWGETASWTATPGVAGANQAVFQSNGIYNPATGHTIWTTPYLSNLKVGNLAALSTNTGALTVTGAINAGSGTFTVAPDGTVVAKNLSIQKADGTVILSSGVPLAISYAPAGTVNSNITLNANGTLSGAGSGAVTIAGLDNTVLRSGTQITAANASTYIANAGIDGTYISNLTAGSIAARTITAAQVAAGTLTANEILVGSLTADRIQANSLTSTQIQAGGITADRLNIGGNPNLVPNSGPKIINKGWTYGSAYSGTINGLYFADPTAATYAPPGLSGLWVQFPQTPNPNPTGYIDIYGDLFFVTPNAFYECSAYLSTVRASATIYISWNNGADQFIRGSVESNAINFVNPAYTSPLSDWNAIGRATMSIQVPADSGITKARFVVRVRPNESTGNGYCFASGMMMAEKKANQTSFSDYKPGGSAGVQIDASGITTPNLSSLSATIGTLRTATTGARTEIADNQMRVYDAANTLRVIVGSF